MTLTGSPTYTGSVSGGSGGFGGNGGSGSPSGEPGGNGTSGTAQNANLGQQGGTLLTAVATTTAVVSDHPNPTGSVYGDDVTFTATVSAASGTPSGSIQFQIDSVDFGAPVPLDGSQMASFHTTNLAAGDHTIAALFTSSSTAFVDSSGTVAQHVDKARLHVQPDANTKVYGDPVPPLTVGVTGFVNGDTSAIITSPFTATTTATATSSVAGSPYDIAPVGGAISSSNYVLVFHLSNLVVTPRDLTITADNTTKLAGTANPLLTFTPTGFAPSESAANLSTQPTLATTAVTGSPAGPYPITVSGAVGANYSIHYVNGTLTVTAPTIATTTKITSSRNPSIFGDCITFTAIVCASSGKTPPGGAVTFLDGTTVLGTVTLHVSGGVDKAVFTTSSLIVGNHPITAMYGGNSTFSASTSAVLHQVVNKAATCTTLRASCASAAYGQSVTFTATVQSTSGTPTGCVTFMDGSTVLGTVPLSGGHASFTTSTLGVGTHSIKAVYSGSGNFSGSTSSTLRESICKATTTLACSAPLKTTSGGQSVTLTAELRCSTGTPTGAVTFMDGNKVLGTGTLSVVGGVVQAKCSLSSLSVGTHSITAVYSGNTNFNSCKSSSFTETITKAVPAASNAVVASGLAAKSSSTVNPLLAGTGNGTTAIAAHVTDLVHSTSQGTTWRFD